MPAADSRRCTPPAPWPVSRRTRRPRWQRRALVLLSAAPLAIARQHPAGRRAVAARRVAGGRGSRHVPAPAVRHDDVRSRAADHLLARRRSDAQAMTRRRPTRDFDSLRPDRVCAGCGHARTDVHPQLHRLDGPRRSHHRLDSDLARGVQRHAIRTQRHLGPAPLRQRRLDGADIPITRRTRSG